MLETEFETAEGAVRVIDFMPRRAEGPPRFMRIVEGLRGRVPMRMELALRPDYGSITPWVEPASDGAIATAGPDAFRLSTPLALEVRDGTVSAEFVVAEGSPGAPHAHLARLVRGNAAGRGRRFGAGSDGGVVAVVERPLRV